MVKTSIMHNNPGAGYKKIRIDMTEIETKTKEGIPASVSFDKIPGSR